MPHRTRTTDQCPGTLTLHAAADGLLARVRVPGGALGAAALRGLADAAEALGDGRIELTSRANIQLRGLSGPEPLATRLADLGLLPSITHERVRNIVASPLSDVDGQGADVTAVVAELDRALCANPRLAGLPGRFLFAVDDGRGDLAGLDADVVLTPVGDRTHVAPLDVTVPDGVGAALAVAEAFLDARSSQHTPAWRIRELPDPAAVHVPLPGATPHRLAPRPPVPRPVGRVGADAVAVLAPLGRLDAGRLRLLAGLCGPRGVRITPWRSVVLTGVDPEHALATAGAAGFGVHPGSPWSVVTSCAGRPGCAKSHADVQADAAAVVAAGGIRPDRRRVHWSGCARCCGRPPGAVVDVQASEHGYGVRAADGRILRVAEHRDLADAIRHAQEEQP